MARTAKVVDKHAMQAEIHNVEKKNGGPFPSLTALFNAIAEREWAKNNGVTAAIMFTRYNEFKLNSKTKKGKPGKKPSESRSEPKQERTTDNGPIKQFLEPWTRRGLNPERPEDLVASLDKSDSHNAAIYEAWDELIGSILRAGGRVPTKEQWTQIYARLGRALPASIRRMVSVNDLKTGAKTVDGVSINPRVETVR